MVFVVLAVSFAIGSIVLSDTLTEKFDRVTAVEFQNATFTPMALNTNYTVAANDRQFCQLTATPCVVYNGTHNTVPKTNFTVRAVSSSCAFYVEMVDDMFNASTLRLDNCTATGAAFDFFLNATESGQASISEFMSWAPTLAVVIAGVIVLSTVAVFLVSRLL